MKNCWVYAMERLCRNEGWLFVRFTRRCNNNSKFRSKFLGNVVMGIGVFLLNWGAYIRTGRWLHAYHTNSMSSPIVSYEPINGVNLTAPPMSFKGRIVRKKSVV